MYRYMYVCKLSLAAKCDLKDLDMHRWYISRTEQYWNEITIHVSPTEKGDKSYTKWQGSYAHAHLDTLIGANWSGYAAAACYYKNSSWYKNKSVALTVKIYYSECLKKKEYLTYVKQTARHNIVLMNDLKCINHLHVHVVGHLAYIHIMIMIIIRIRIYIYIYKWCQSCQKLMISFELPWCSGEVALWWGKGEGWSL